MLAWTLHIFQRESRIDRILLTYPRDDAETEQRYREIVDQEKITKATLVCGGEERYHSVRNAFLAIESPGDQDLVLIHDAARPLLTAGLLRRLIEAGEKDAAVIPVVPVVETLKEIDQQVILRSVPRRNMALAQTPQVFRYAQLKAAYAKAEYNPEITDEAMLLERASIAVSVIPGERRNIKITELFDLKLAEYYMDQGEES